MDLTKYWPTDIMKVAHDIGGKLAYNPGVQRKYKVDSSEECANLNHAEVLVDPICEGVYLTLRQDLPWGGTDTFDSSIVISFCRTIDKYFVVNTWFGRPVYIPGSEWEKAGFRLESDSYGAWEKMAQASHEEIVKWLLNVEKMVNDKWRELKRMKISRHQREIKEAAYGFDR
jgi:hypothetical protein